MTGEIVSNKDTALMIACENENIEEVKKVLINIKNNINYSYIPSKSINPLSGLLLGPIGLIGNKIYNSLSKEEYPRSALTIASKNGNGQIVKLLLDNGADYDKSPALIIACDNKHKNIVKLILDKVSSDDLDYYRFDNTTALEVACRKGYLKIVKLLLDSHSYYDINEIQNKHTVLTIACENNSSYKIVKVLLEAGADTNACSIDFSVNSLQDDNSTACESPLFFACKNNNKEVIKLLLENKAEANYNFLGETPLMFAWQHFKKEIEENEPYKNLNFGTPRDPFTVDVEIIKLLIEKKVSVEYHTHTDYRTTRFGSADDDVCKKLYELKNHTTLKLISRDKNYEDKYKKKEEQKKKHIEILTEILKLMVKKCVDVNINSLLKDVYEADDEDLMKFVFENGADENILYDEELTFLEHAKGRDSKKWFRKLIGEQNSHNPRELSKTLQQFSAEDFQYTNHDWDIELDYDSFIANLKQAMPTIDEDLGRFSPTLGKKINSFFFDNLNEKNTIEFCGDIISIGWSSESLKEYKPAGTTNKPEKFSNFGDMINSFKRSIVLKDEEGLSILDLFDRLLSKQELTSIDINLENIEQLKFKIFTDVDRLETIIFSILKENLKHDNQARVRIDTEGTEDYFDIKIVHEGSTFKVKAQDLSDTIGKTGTFTTIYKNTLSLCDWSVVTECEDGKKIIDFRYPEIDNSKPHIKDIPDAIDGFTHRLRFYK